MSAEGSGAKSRPCSRGTSANSSHRPSPLLRGSQQPSPMIGTHPILHAGSGTVAAPSVSAELLALPDSTADERGADTESLYNVRDTTATAAATRKRQRTSRSTSARDGDDDGSGDADGVRLGQLPSAAARKREPKKKAKRPQVAVAVADTAVVQDELARLSTLFTRVEFLLQMHLAPLHQQRSALFPRDIGNLLLWSVPTAIPLVESPRMFFLKNKSRLRDVVVIYVNGWSYDMMMCTGAGLKPRARDRHAESAAAPGPAEEKNRHCGNEGEEEKKENEEEEEEEEEVWNNAICSALLGPIRRNQCWARQGAAGSTGGGVQYAPLFLPNLKNTLEEDLFWRNDVPRQPRSGGSSGGRSSAPGEANDDDVPDQTRNVKSHEEARGVGSTFRRAKELMRSATSSPVERSDSGPLPAAVDGTAPTGEVAHTAAEPVVGDESADRLAAMALAPLWGDRHRLEEYALQVQQHRMILDELGFVLEAPQEGSGPDPAWSSFPAATSIAEAAGARDGSEHAAPPAPPPRVYAFDCEMVRTASPDSALARATLVDLRAGRVVFDMLVKPAEPVVNYLTRFSGIDEEMLRDVTHTLADCQAALRGALDTDSFLVGHSLENDLKACRMLPNCRILDSAWLYPHPSGLPYKNALKFLTMRYLGRRIQQGSHDSTTDAIASAELVYLKMQMGPQFGVRERVSVLGLISAAAAVPPPPATTTTTTTPPRDGADAVPPPTDSVESSAAPEGSRHPHVPSSSCVPLSVQLFDDAQVLTTIMPRVPSARKSAPADESASHAEDVRRSFHLSAIDSVPVRSDKDATRKIARALEKRQQQQPHEQGAETDRPFSLMWVQLTETRDVDVVVRVPALDKRGASTRAGKGPSAQLRHLRQQQLEAEEAAQLERVDVTNKRVLRIVEACPDESLVIVLAGDCVVGAGGSASGGPGQSNWACNNQYSRAQGAAFFFVKDSTAPGPPSATATAASADASGAASVPAADTATGQSAEGTGGAQAIPTPPACQPQ